MLRANMELALRTLESAEDMTAAEMAPRPKNATTPGVMYCKTIGRMSFCRSGGIGKVPLYSVRFQSRNKAKTQLFQRKTLFNNLKITYRLILQ
jgi:hypothetical protein